MKTKSLITTIIFITTLSAANAQLRTGIKGGVNISWFTKAVDPFDVNSEYYSDYAGFRKHVRTGITGGFFVMYDASNFFSFGTEVLYSGRGNVHRVENRDAIQVDNEGNQQFAYDTYTYKIDYVELPLYVQRNLAHISNTGLDFYAGIAPAYAFHKKRVYTYYDVSGYVDNTDKQKRTRPLEDVRNFNIFPIAGIKLGGSTGFFDLRASLPFYPVFTSSSAPGGGNLSTRMWTIALTGGFYF